MFFEFKKYSRSIESDEPKFQDKKYKSSQKWKDQRDESERIINGHLN